MEDAFIINGGKKLRGEVVLSGAKNVALKTIIAALLFKTPVVLRNIPRIIDVFELLGLIKTLGGKADFVDNNEVFIDGSAMKNNKLDLLSASKIRVSFMFFAPLLYKFNHCYVPNPGGCRIGARPIDRIIEGIRALGVSVEYDHKTGYYEAKLTGKPAGSFKFNKPSHTGTELLIMMAVFGRGKIIIENAANEPEIDDLIEFLNQAGAKIKHENGSIAVEGVNELRQSKPFKIMVDRNEAVTFAALALATGGDLTLSGTSGKMIETFIDKVRLADGGVEVLNENRVRFYFKNQIKPVNVETETHPGFMTDWQPNWAILMTRAHGESVIHERVFENRFSYVEELRKLGARIVFIDKPVEDPETYYYFNFDKSKKYQQAIRITGPTVLHNGVLRIYDLRAGASLVIAALTAEGESVVQGASIVERGYEDFIGKIKKIGGDIRKV